MTNVLITAYCACTICCGPTAPQPTAAGIKPAQGITVAASRRYPLGSAIYISIPGVMNNRRYKIQDRLHNKYDNRVDIYFSSHKQAKQFGIKKGFIWIHNSKNAPAAMISSRSTK